MAKKVGFRREVSVILCKSRRHSITQTSQQKHHVYYRSSAHCLHRSVSTNQNPPFLHAWFHSPEQIFKYSPTVFQRRWWVSQGACDHGHKNVKRLRYFHSVFSISHSHVNFCRVDKCFDEVEEFLN